MNGFDNLTLDHVQFTVQGARSDVGDFFVTTLFIAAVVMLLERLLESYLSSVSYKLLIIIVTMAYYVIQYMVLGDDSEKFIPASLKGGKSIAMIMPMILLKVTSTLDIYVFKKCFFQIVMLSTIGMVLFGLLVGYTSFPFENKSNAVLWVHMLAYALTFSSTDDVEISKSYLEYEAIRDALVILDGEFLITSAFCIFGLNISPGLFEGFVSEWYQVLFLLIRYVGLGIVVGYPFGWLIAFILPHMLDDIPGFAISLIVFVYFVYFVCEFVLYCSGTIATFIVCTFTITIRKRLSSDTHAVLEIIFDLLYSIVMHTRFLMSAYIEIHYMFFSFTSLKFVQWVAMFFILFIGRNLVLVILYPVFKYTGARLQLKSVMVLFWLSKKGIIQLLSVESLYSNKLVLEKVYSIGGYVIISITLGLIFQSIFTKTFLKSFRLSEVASNNKHNLSKCINLINTRNMLLIDISKTYRLFSEIKWRKINDVTALFDPYLSYLKLRIKDKKPLRTFCEECKQEVYIKQIKRDFSLVVREAKLRVLKAYKVSIQRLFRKNLIEEDTVKYILERMENFVESKDFVFVEESLLQQLNKRTLLDALKDFLIDIGKEEIVLKPPRKKFRRICYKIISIKGYELLIYLLCVSLVVHYYYRITHFETRTEMIRAHLIELFYTILFAVDIFIKIMAYSHITVQQGIRLYMSNKWNLLDFITLFSNIFVVIAINFNLLSYLRKKMGFAFMAIMFFIRQIALLGLLRTIVIFNQHRKWFVKICNMLLSKSKSFSYDVVKALLMCHDDIIHMLPTMELSPDVYVQLVQLLEGERARIQIEMYHMNMALPSFVSKNHTKMVCNGTLGSIQISAAILKISGFLGYTEELGEKYMTKKKLKISVPESLSAIDVLKSTIWLQETEIFDMAIKIARIVSWKENDVIIKTGQVASGVVILTEGMLMSHYEPTTESLEQVKNYGILPIADCYDYKDFFSKVQKCLVPGSSVGLLSVLSGRKNDATIVAKVESKGFYIPQLLFLENINKYSDPINGFYSTLWKSVCFDIAHSLLWESKHYRSKTQLELYTYMYRSFVPYLCNKRTFVVNEFVEDIVLIEGMVKDMVSKLLYFGPVCLPRGIICLELLREKDMVEPKLWIVSTRNAVISNILNYDDSDAHRISRF